MCNSLQFNVIKCIQIYLLILSEWCYVFSHRRFPRATSQVTMSPMAASQMCHFPTDNGGQGAAARMAKEAERCWQNRDGDRALRVEQGRGPSAAGKTGKGTERFRQDRFWKQPLGNQHIREVAKLKNIPLGSLRLGKCFWESIYPAMILPQPILKWFRSLLAVTCFPHYPFNIFN